MSLRILVFGAFCAGASGQTVQLPARSANPLSGTAFVQKIATLDLRDRENEIFAQITSGNVPNFLRKLCPVQVTNVVDGKANHATFYVTPDYLAVGSDDDYFLTQISPRTAQRIADAVGCMLPTRKMVNDIYAAAQVKLAPSPVPPSSEMTTVPVFSNHNVIVKRQRAEYLKEFPLGALVAGHQKDVVASARLASAPGKVAIYGWHQTNGLPIQPLYLGHADNWVDYSQCTRLVQNRMLVNGTNSTVAQVLADPHLCGLLSDEGPVIKSRYPTNDLTQFSTNAISTNKSHPSLGNFSGFQETNLFDERITSFTMEPEIKVLIDAPATNSLSSSDRILLVFYALPNGNTIAQTFGKVPRGSDDWHYDIQHIGAQTRFLRSMIREKSIIVVYLENNLQSWPAWRKKYGDDVFPQIIKSVKQLFVTNRVEIVLSSHSGGGSFIFGYLNTLGEIPDDIVRINFLDSNYAYDRTLRHNERLSAWLKSDSKHYLCVLAYNDAAGLLNGKPFVSAAGGTWGKSHEMQGDLAKGFNFTSRTNGLFEKYSALDGRVQFILRDNPQRKIFHTTQVELNGFIHSMVSGTTNENRGYEYFGERAYSKWIDTEPVSDPPPSGSKIR